MPYVKKERSGRPCSVCGVVFSALMDRAKYCSERCRGADVRKIRCTRELPVCTVAGCADSVFAKGLCVAHYNKQRTYGDPLGCSTRQEALRLIMTRSCAHCGQQFVSRQIHPTRYKMCSRECAAAAKRVHTTRADERRAHSHTRAARVKATSDGSVTSKKAIFERDRYICYLCNEPTRPDLPHRHPLSPRLEHAVSLAQGGTHTGDNVFCAHNGCNTRKGTKPWYDILLA